MAKKKYTPKKARRDAKLFLLILCMLAIGETIWGDTEKKDFIVVVLLVLLGIITGLLAMYGWPEIWSKDWTPKLVYDKKKKS